MRELTGDGAAERDGTLTLRWREPRLARGILRLAQRVRADVQKAELYGILAGVARCAHADEFRVELSNGIAVCVKRRANGTPFGARSASNRDPLSAPV